MIARVLSFAVILTGLFAANAASQTLTVSVTGEGKVTGSGIDCPSDCTENFLPTSIRMPGRPAPPPPTIVLTAAPVAGYELRSWTPNCPSGGTPLSCSFTVSGETITATFSPLPVLSVSVVGSGTVSSISPAEIISCPPDCSEPIKGAVRLRHVAAAGHTFIEWSGCTQVAPTDSGWGECRVNLDASRSITATFREGLPLIVSIRGYGSVTSTPAGINCSNGPPSNLEVRCGDPNSPFASTVVTLSAATEPGWTVSEWLDSTAGNVQQICLAPTGGLSPATCAVNVVPGQRVKVIFKVAAAVTLNVMAVGGGGVTSSPGGINCGAIVCSTVIPTGTGEVTLTAIAGPGHFFAGWHHSEKQNPAPSTTCTGQGTTCVLKASPNTQTVIAVFLPSP